MVWMNHKKYTAEYVSNQMADMVGRVRKATRRMVMVASAAVGVMAAAEVVYLYGLLGA